MTEQKKETVQEKIARMRALTAAKSAEGMGDLTMVGGQPSGIVGAAGLQNNSQVPENFLNFNQKFPSFDPAKLHNTLQNLERGLNVQAPGLPSYLKDISDNLIQYPELVHIMTDEQLKIIASGIMFKTDMNVATVISRSKTRELTIDEGRAIF